MSTFHVEFDVDNSAFEDSSEVSRILRALAHRVQVQVVVEDDTTYLTANTSVTVVSGGTSREGWPLSDINGARVGSAWIEEDR